MSYEEFRIGILKANQKKHHFKVNNSYGTKDAYRWAMKHKMVDRSLSEKNFREIINAINQSLQDRLLCGKEIKLPAMMGSIGIRKLPVTIGFMDGKIKTNLPVDWDKTLRLWYEDAEAHEKKTLVRCDEKEKFKFHYDKSKAIYNNKLFFEFTPTRDVRIKLKNIIDNQGFDALLLNDANGLHKHKRDCRQD